MTLNACFLASFDQTYTLRQSLKFNKFNFTVERDQKHKKYCKIGVPFNYRVLLFFIMLILYILVGTKNIE